MPDGRKRQVGLEHQARMVERGLWPTPMARAFLPTPTASQEAKNSTLPPSQMKRDNLAGYLLRNGERGQLNPEWVEWLMGFPVGWTASRG